VTGCEGRKQECRLIESFGDADTMPFIEDNSYDILGCPKKVVKKFGLPQRVAVQNVFLKI